MKALAERISEIDGVNIYGRVVSVRGLTVEIAEPDSRHVGGDRAGGGRFIPSEVIGFTGSNSVMVRQGRAEVTA